MDKSTHILYMYILVKAGIVRGLLGAELYFMLCTQSQYSTVYSIQCEYTVKKTNYSRFKLEDFRCVLQQLKQTHLFRRNSQYKSDTLKSQPKNQTHYSTYCRVSMINQSACLRRFPQINHMYILSPVRLSSAEKSDTVYVLILSA